MPGILEVARKSGLHPLRCPECGCRLDALEAIRFFFKTIIELVKLGEKVNILGFGVFSAKLLKGRLVTTPLVEGGSIQSQDRLVLRFHQAKGAKEELNRQVGPKRRVRSQKKPGKKKGRPPKKKKGGSK